MTASLKGDTLSEWYLFVLSAPTDRGPFRVIVQPSVTVVPDSKADKLLQVISDTGDPRATEMLAAKYQRIGTTYRPPPENPFLAQLLSTTPGWAVPFYKEFAPDVREIATQKGVELHSKALKQKQELDPRVRSSYKTAERTLLRLASNGNATANWQLALLYEKTSALSDEQLREKYSQKAIDLQVIEALLAKAAELESSSDSAKSVDLLRQAASQGSVEAMSRLALHYSFLNLGGSQDAHRQEVEWKQQAALHGDIHSAVELIDESLGRGYRPDGVESASFDPDEAKRWALRASSIRPDLKDKVFGNYYLELADAYFNGVFVARNLEKAEEAIKQAESSGTDTQSSRAKLQSFRGMYALAGYEEPRDLRKAVEIFQSCAKNSFICAYYLGYAYDFGKGVPIDKTAARNEYENALRLGLTKSLKYFGLIGIQQTPGDPLHDVIGGNEWIFEPRDIEPSGGFSLFLMRIQSGKKASVDGLREAKFKQQMRSDVPSQGTTKGDIDIKGDIESIGGNRFTPMPDSQTRSSPDGPNANPTRTFYNDTSYNVHVLLSGPADQKADVLPGTSLSLVLPAGLYRIAARVDSPNISPFYGTQTLELGHVYTSRFSIR